MVNFESFVLNDFDSLNLSSSICNSQTRYSCTENRPKRQLSHRSQLDSFPDQSIAEPETLKFRSIEEHGREMDSLADPRKGGPVTLLDSTLPADSSVISEEKVPEEKRQKITDVRFRRPRIQPTLGKWDPRQDDGPQLLHPSCNPKWLLKIQKKLPWYENTISAGGGPWLSLRSWDAPYQFFTNEIRIRWANIGDRWFFCCRLSVIVFLLLTFILINVAGLGNFYANIEGVTEIWDWFHEISIPINKWLHDSETGYSVFMFFAGLLMDILFLWVFFQWAIVGDSFRLPLAYAMLYGLRGIQRAYVLLPFAPGYIWKAPKFGSVEWPSLVVPVRLGTTQIHTLCFSVSAGG